MAARRSTTAAAIVSFLGAVDLTAAAIKTDNLAHTNRATLIYVMG